MSITTTNGNSKNGIRGSRLRFWNSKGIKVGELIVPAWNGKKYCQNHKAGFYGRKFVELCELASK